MGLPHVDAVYSTDTSKHRSIPSERVFTDMWLLHVKATEELTQTEFTVCI